MPLMRAARFYEGSKSLRVEEVPRPEPGPGEALVRVRAAGVCHTDLHFLDGLLPPGKSPLVLGHEVAGVVEALGGQAPGLQVGERVVAYYYAPCGRCRCCRRGWENLCANLRGQLGFLTDGGFAEYVVVAADSLVPLPERVSFEAGATLACGATTALHALREIAGVRLGETVVVYGVGGVGLAMVQMAKRMGVRVIAVSRTAAKLERAAALGADHTINAAEQDPVEAVRMATDGAGADAVFELVGVRETMDSAAAMLGKRGRLVFIGYSTDDFVVSPINLVIGEQVVTASVGNTLTELQEVVRLASEGAIQPVVARTFPLDQINDALELLRAGELVGRAVLLP